MRYYLACSLIVLFWTIRLEANTHVATYRVLEVSGQAQKRSFLAVVWSAIRKGDVLYSNDMITVDENARLRLRPLLKTAEDQADLVITRPLVTRIGGELMRRVKVSSVVASGILKAGAEAEQKSEVDFREAWSKFVALGSGTEGGDAVSKSQTLQSDSYVAKSAKKLNITVPKPNQALFSRDLPYAMQLRWLRPEGFDGQFEIFAWHEDDKKPEEATADSRFESHVVSLGRYGKFFVQIRSRDQQWQSLVYPFSLAPVNTLARKGEAVDWVDLNFPPPDYLRLSADQRVDFSWTLKSSGRGRETYLEIKDSKGTSQRIRANRNVVLAVPLSPGRYSWRLMQRLHRSRYTPWQALEVKEMPVVAGHSILKTLIDQKLKGTIDFDFAAGGLRQ